jgi:hypothetical protein
MSIIEGHSTGGDDAPVSVAQQTWPAHQMWPGGGPGGGQAMPDGTLPSPGGWNRFAIEVEDLAATDQSSCGKQT